MTLADDGDGGGDRLAHVAPVHGAGCVCADRDVDRRGDAAEVLMDGLLSRGRHRLVPRVWGRIQMLGGGLRDAVCGE